MSDLLLQSLVLSRRRHPLTSGRPHRWLALGLLLLAAVALAPAASLAQSIILPANPSVHAGSTYKFNITVNGGAPPPGGWGVWGGFNNGVINPDGTYVAPNTVPTPNTVTIDYSSNGHSLTTQQVTITNPVPILNQIAPSTFTSKSTNVLLYGWAFVPGATVTIGGTTYTNVSNNGSQIYIPNVVLTNPPANGTVAVTVTNPDPGSSSATLYVPTNYPAAAAPDTSTAAILPANPSVHASTSQKFTVTVNGGPAPAGGWFVEGGFNNGVINPDGTYWAPNNVPSPNTVVIDYASNGSVIARQQLTVTNPVPILNQSAPSVFNSLTSNLLLYGWAFVPGATVTVQGVTYTPTYNNGAQIYVPNVTLTNPPANGTVPVVVTNPNPGASSSAILNVPTNFPAPAGGTSILPANPSVHASGNQKFTITVNGGPPPGGGWFVEGGFQNGVINPDGTYYAPNVVPSPSTITIDYSANGGVIARQQLTITNPVPVINQSAPSTFTSLTNNLLLYGAAFIPGATVTVQGVTYTPTYNNGAQIYVPNVTLTSPPTNGVIPVIVSNPNPGSSSATLNIPSLFPAQSSVTPTTLAPGWNTVTVTGTGFTSGSIVTLDGRPMRTTFNSPTSMTGYGYEPAWKTGTSVVGVIPSPGAPSESNTTLPISTTPIPYDTAARFLTQAGMGPRPDLVEHVQQIGLAPFITEQLGLPGVSYSAADSPRLDYLHGTLQSGVSQLRLRVAAALNSYIPNQMIFYEYPSFVPWEQKLESDATGNYRQILTDITADPRLGAFLSNAGNDVSASNPNLHPTQNFARELMQLFSLGVNLLNDDGSLQLDGSGQPIATYDQNTVLDLSRALTGWDLPTPVNPAFTAFLIDESQLLTPVEANHDHGAKTIFGNINLPAGQTTTQDRDQALDAIFAHPNLPPFVSTILIHHLVTSNPSPAYIQRVVNVFKNNGKGIRGDMAAVVTAILLDPEARAGDTKPGPNDGFLQDPQLFQTFAISALQDPGTDGEQIYVGSDLGQTWWMPNTVFDFYPQAAPIPGTAIDSPEFVLLNNITILQRSQILYGIVAGLTVGFDTEYQANSWLFTAFTNVPDLVDGLNHLLYHGQMSTAEQTAIINYCSGISNQQQAFSYAVFLALNADSFSVTH